MKKFILSLLVCFAFIGTMQAQVLPSDFLMYGQVKRTSDQTAVANHMVIVYEMNNSSVIWADTVYTATNGTYSYTVVNGSLIGANRIFFAKTYDCQNAAQVVQQQNNQGTTDYGIYNFEICDFNNTCQAGFDIIQNPNQWNSIYFSNQSVLTAGTITSWSWSYGDGTGQSSPQPNISSNHVYANAGVYVACFTITTSEGCTSTTCDTVVVNSPCAGSAGIVNQAPPGGLAFVGYATWDNQIVNNATYSWNWGDGQTFAGGPTTQHQYADPGTYNVCVTITNNGCIDDYCQTIIIGGNSNCFISMNPIQGNGPTYSFISTATGVAPISYEYFVNGNSVSSGPPTYNYVAPNYGIYAVCVVSTDANGCTASICDSFDYVNPCNALFNYAPGNALYTFIVTPSVTGGTWTGPVLPNPNGVITYTGPGTYQLCYTVTVNGQSCTTCQNIVVNNTGCQASFTHTIDPNGLTAFNNNSQSNNNGSITSYSWNFGDGTTSSDGSPIHQFNPNTLHVVCLTITTQNGCTSTYCDTVIAGGQNPNPCIADFNWYHGNNFLNGIIFQSNSESNGNGTITSYAWDFGDGSTGTGPNPDHSYPQSGWYFVCLTITTQNGCSSTYCDSVSIAPINVPCQASFETTYSSNPGTTGNIYVFHSTADPSLNNQWNINGQQYTGTDVTYVFNHPGTYQVCLTVWSTGGCQDSECHSVIITGDSTNTTPCEASFTYHAAQNNLLEYVFESTSNPDLDQVWTINGQTFTGLTMYYNFPGPGTYQVCLAVSGDSCYDSHCEVIYVGSQDSTICDASFTYSAQNSGYVFQSTSNQSLFHGWVIDNSYTYSGYDFNHPLTPGTHVVCLTVYNGNGCQDTECQTIVVADPNTPNCNSTISGNVSYADVNCNICVNDAIALLYQLTPDSLNTLTATLVNVTLVNQGSYTFTGLCDGQYIVQAMIAPNSPNYILYMPTYSFSEPQWFNSPVLNATANANLTADVSLIPMNNPGGNGILGGGTIIPGLDTVRAMGPVQGIKIYLSLVGGDYVTYTFSDGNGQFTIGNLPFGTYNICADYPGYITGCQQVTLDANNPTITDLQLDFSQTAVGITEEDANVNVGNLCPNPANSETFMNVELKQASRITVNIINAVGQIVYTQNFNLPAGKQLISLPVTGLAQGMYTLTLTGDTNAKPITKKLLKY